MAGLSSIGIGSGLDIQGIIDKLMAAESQAPRAALAKKEASYQAKLSAYGTLSGALSSLQSAVASLNNQSTFNAVNAAPSDATIFTASASSSAGVGSYSINVTKLAQAQTLSAAGQTSTTATIGSGATTKLTFQFGTLSTSGNLTKQSANLSAAAVSGGIAAGSLSINGTTITTGAGTTSAQALAAAINLQTGATGVTATAQATDTGALGAFTTTTGAGYTLDVGGVNIINNGLAGTDATAVDTAVAAAAATLTAAGISFSGTAAAGTLKFTKADGSNIAIQESGGASGGFAASIGMGTTKTFTSSVSLSSATTLTVSGSNPSAAGFSAGSGLKAFTQSANQPSALVTIDNTNNSLQGIRDAINKANIGVSASIVSDGNATKPYHLVIKSNKTGEESSMRISVQSGGDATLAGLLSFDASGTTLTETSAAQNAALTVNGIAVSSQTNTVSGAIEGVSLDLAKTGSSNLNVTSNTNSVKASVDAFVKAFNDVNSTIQKLTGYNAETKQGGPLTGDSSVRTVESELRKMLSSTVSDSSSTLKTLRDAGISVSKDGVMSLDSSKLSAAMAKDLDDVAALFSSVGKTSDSLVSFVNAGSTSTPGEYDIYVSKLATQGKVTGSQNLTLAPITINSSNRDLTITVDGTTASVALPLGTYNSAELATLVQSTINGASALSSQGIAVSAAVDASGHLNITSNKYGSSSKVSVSGTSVAALIGTATSTDGLDVVGTIAGVAAKGDGQFLIGADGSPAAGLKLQINGGSVGQGRVTGSAAIGTTINAGSNDSLTVTLNGVTTTVTLAAASYTPATMAAQVQSAINAAPAFSAAGVTVSATLDDSNRLIITSSTSGPTSAVSVSGNSVANLLGASPITTSGATAGARGTIKFSKGFAFHLNELVSGFLGDKGLLGSRTDGLKNSIKDIGKQRDALEARLTNTEARYRKQFLALDATISKMNSTSSYLTQQLTQISNLSK